ncbi:hypothetical protein D3C84_950240 [compost metagenome]
MLDVIDVTLEGEVAFFLDLLGLFIVPSLAMRQMGVRSVLLSHVSDGSGAVQVT